MSLFFIALGYILHVTPNTRFTPVAGFNAVDNQYTPPAERSVNGTLVHLPEVVSLVYLRFLQNFLSRRKRLEICLMNISFGADENGGRPTGEEGLHGGTLSQLDWRLSRVSGQSRVCAVVQQQPDYWKVVARYGVVERPEERKKGNLVQISVHLETCKM